MPEEFGGGSANFEMLQRGGSFYSFGINGGGDKNNQRKTHQYNFIEFGNIWIKNGKRV